MVRLGTATLFDMSHAEEEEAKEVRVSLHPQPLSPMPPKSNIPMAQVKVDKGFLTDLINYDQRQLLRRLKADGRRDKGDSLGGF
jgi:hypothetical protein